MHLHKHPTDVELCFCTSPVPPLPSPACPSPPSSHTLSSSVSTRLAFLLICSISVLMFDVLCAPTARWRCTFLLAHGYVANFHASRASDQCRDSHSMGHRHGGLRQQNTAGRRRDVTAEDICWRLRHSWCCVHGKRHFRSQVRRCSWCVPIAASFPLHSYRLLRAHEEPALGEWTSLSTRRDYLLVRPVRCWRTVLRHIQ